MGFRGVSKCQWCDVSGVTSAALSCTVRDSADFNHTSMVKTSCFFRPEMHSFCQQIHMKMYAEKHRRRHLIFSTFGVDKVIICVNSGVHICFCLLAYTTCIQRTQQGGDQHEHRKQLVLVKSTQLFIQVINAIHGLQLGYNFISTRASLVSNTGPYNVLNFEKFSLFKFKYSHFTSNGAQSL